MNMRYSMTVQVHVHTLPTVKTASFDSTFKPFFFFFSCFGDCVLFSLWDHFS